MDTRHGLRYGIIAHWLFGRSVGRNLPESGNDLSGMYWYRIRSGERNEEI